MGPWYNKWNALLPVVDTIHSQSNKCVTDVKIKATSDWKRHDSLVYSLTTAVGKL